MVCFSNSPNHPSQRKKKHTDSVEKGRHLHGKILDFQNSIKESIIGVSGLVKSWRSWESGMLREGMDAHPNRIHKSIKCGCCKSAIFPLQVLSEDKLRAQLQLLLGSGLEMLYAPLGIISSPAQPGGPAPCLSPSRAVTLGFTYSSTVILQ